MVGGRCGVDLLHLQRCHPRLQHTDFIQILTLQLLRGVSLLLQRFSRTGQPLNGGAVGFRVGFDAVHHRGHFLLHVIAGWL